MENAIKEVPSFLKNPELTKPDPEVKHKDKLIEISLGFDKDDAEVVCKIFARKYPDIMLNAIKTEILDLSDLRDGVVKTIEVYDDGEIIR